MSDSPSLRDQPNGDVVLNQARQAAYEAFAFKDAYTEEDFEAVADAAMTAALMAQEEQGGAMLKPEELEIATAGLRSLLDGRAETHIADCDRCQLARRTLARLEALK